MFHESRQMMVFMSTTRVKEKQQEVRAVLKQEDGEVLAEPRGDWEQCDIKARPAWRLFISVWLHERLETHSLSGLWAHGPDLSKFSSSLSLACECIMRTPWWCTPTVSSRCKHQHVQNMWGGMHTQITQAHHRQILWVNLSKTCQGHVSPQNQQEIIIVIKKKMWAVLANLKALMLDCSGRLLCPSGKKSKSLRKIKAQHAAQEVSVIFMPQTVQE